MILLSIIYFNLWDKKRNVKIKGYSSKTDTLLPTCAFFLFNKTRKNYNTLRNFVSNVN